MSEKLRKVSDKAQFVETYHLLMKAANTYSFISANIPNALLEVSQRIHGRFDDAAFNVFKASNTFDNSCKLMCINTAKDDVFYQFNSLEYLVKTRAITTKAANTVLDVLAEAHTQLTKWYNYLISHSESS